MRRIVPVSLCVLAVCLQVSAQPSRFELGFGMGASVYQGDLSPFRLGSFNKPGFAFQVLFQYNPHPALSLRGNFAFASLQEDESSYHFAYHSHRNFRFETSVNELSALVVVHPLRKSGKETPGHFSPYVFGGAGISFLSVQRDWSRFNQGFGWQQWVRPGLANDTATTPPRSVIVYPVGAGIQYFFGEKLSLYAEGAHRITRNGYIDGFSLAANPLVNDSYSSYTIGLIFRLSGNDGGRGGRSTYDCPVNVW